MKLKYWGKAYETGLTLTADLFDNEMNLIHSGFSMSELNTSNYATTNIFTVISPISAGIYVMRIKDSVTGDYLGHEEFVFNGTKVLNLLDIQFLTDKEKMQLRDALGLDGDKVLAKGGQLQMKGEGPYNATVNTNKILKQ